MSRDTSNTGPRSWHVRACRCAILALLGLACEDAVSHALIIRQSLMGSVGLSLPMAPADFERLWNPGYGIAGSVRLRIVPRFHVNLEVGYYRHLSDNAAFNAEIARTRPNVTLSGYDLWVIPVGIIGEFDLFKRGSTKPFLMFGGGWYSFGTTDAAVSGLGADQVILPDPSDSAWGIQGGLGVRTPIALGVTLSLDANYHVAFTEGESLAFLPVRVGLQF